MPSPTGYLFADVNTAHLVFHQEDPSSYPIAFVVAQGSALQEFFRFPAVSSVSLSADANGEVTANRG